MKEKEKNVLRLAKQFASIIGSSESEIINAFAAFREDIKNEKEA